MPEEYGGSGAERCGYENLNNSGNSVALTDSTSSLAQFDANAMATQLGKPGAGGTAPSKRVSGVGTYAISNEFGGTWDIEFVADGILFDLLGDESSASLPTLESAARKIAANAE